MWSFVLFDLPVKSKQNRRDYTKFRKLLIQSGFSQLQYSVYARYHESEAQSDTLIRLVRDALPKRGHIRILKVTDRQFGKMENFSAGKRKRTEKTDEQLLLF